MRNMTHLSIQGGEQKVHTHTHTSWPRKVARAAAAVRPPSSLSRATKSCSTIHQVSAPWHGATQAGTLRAPTSLGAPPMTTQSFRTSGWPSPLLVAKVCSRMCGVQVASWPRAQPQAFRNFIQCGGVGKLCSALQFWSRRVDRLACRPESQPTGDCQYQRVYNLF